MEGSNLIIASLRAAGLVELKIPANQKIKTVNLFKKNRENASLHLWPGRVMPVASRVRRFAFVSLHMCLPACQLCLTVCVPLHRLELIR